MNRLQWYWFRFKRNFRFLRRFKWVLIRFRIFCVVNRKKAIIPDLQTRPLWIFGMFRSGTSLTSEMLAGMGVSFGDENHLLQAMGDLRELNPNGFFENYVFAEYSRYFLYQLNAAGDQPPDEEKALRVSFDGVDEPVLFSHSILKIKDDRITAENKFSAMRSLRRWGLTGYIARNFGARPAIKIPLLSFFYPQIRKIWPSSQFLVVFRHPVSTIRSSARLSANSNEDLYISYYSRLLRLSGEENVWFFSYDRLIAEPEKSIRALKKVLGLEINDAVVSHLVAKVDPALIRNTPSASDNAMVSDIYDKLQELAINK